MKNLITFVFYRLKHKNGKTYKGHRTWTWILFSPIILAYYFLISILSALLDFIFEAFDICDPNPYILEDKQKYKSRRRKNRSYIIKQLT